MKKLLLIPATLLTALLAVAFISPATASSAVRAVVPQLHILGASSTTALADSQQASTTSDSSGSSGASGPGSASPGSASPSGDSADLFAALRETPTDGAVHSLATTTNENCGRFGNGFHGGKHLFVCPNRPFPPPPNH
jgi:hypothetical protein